MLLYSENPKNLFQTISTDLVESLKTPPDLSFMCDGGRMVHTHKILLATFSPFLRSMLASLEPVKSSSSVIFSLPEASVSALEEVLQILSKPWKQELHMLNSDQVEIIEVLGIPAGYSKEISVNIEAENSSHESGSHSSSEVIIEVFDTALDNNLNNTPDNPRISDKEDPEATSCIISEEDPEPIGYIISKEPTCAHCDTMFRDTSPDSIEEITIHLGEFHFEMDLQVEQLKLFPIGSNKCNECAKEVTSDYVQKEHILLKHPWPLLKTTVQGIVDKTFQEVSDPEKDINFEETVEEATRSLLKKEFDNIENRTRTQTFATSTDALQKMEDFIKSLNQRKESEMIPSISYVKSKTVPSLKASNAVVPNKVPHNQKHSNASSTLSSRRTVTCIKCPQRWTYNSESRMSDLKSRMKSHIVDVHFEKELKLLLKSSFEGNLCQLCDKTIKTSDLQKKHIRSVHKVLDTEVLPIVESLLGKDMNRKDTSKKIKRKGSPIPGSSHRKLSKIESSNSPAIVNITDMEDIMQDSPQKDSRNSINLDESSNFTDISDSEDDVEIVDKNEICNEIQQNIEFSDSEDDD